MKQWLHEVDPRWLQARKSCLTATDVVNLLPEYRRMLKKPGELSPGCATLWAEKNSTSDVDPWSFNAAARGHIMEPYAVEEYNNLCSSGTEYYHWDDRIIYDDSVKNGTPLAFSPDALTIRQPRKIKIPASSAIFMHMSHMLEIKCYEPKKHIQTWLTGKEDIAERFQVAVAFMLLDSLKFGHLFFYCPTSPVQQMFEFCYTRDELKDEFQIIQDILCLYNEAGFKLQQEIVDEPISPIYTEDDIYTLWQEEQMSPLLIN